MFRFRTRTAVYNGTVLRNLENVHDIFKVGLLNLNFGNKCSKGL